MKKLVLVLVLVFASVSVANAITITNDNHKVKNEMPASGIDCWDIATISDVFIPGSFESVLTACCDADPNCYNLPPVEIAQ